MYNADVVLIHSPFLNARVRFFPGLVLVSSLLVWGAIKTICLAQTNWLASFVALFFSPGQKATFCLSQMNCSFCLPSVKLAKIHYRKKLVYWRT